MLFIPHCYTFYTTYIYFNSVCEQLEIARVTLAGNCPYYRHRIQRRRWVVCWTTFLAHMLILCFVSCLSSKTNSMFLKAMVTDKIQTKTVFDRTMSFDRTKLCSSHLWLFIATLWLTQQLIVTLQNTYDHSVCNST